MTKSKTENSGVQPSSNNSFLKRQLFTPPGLTVQLIFWSLMLAGLALDLWSKRAVFNYLEHQPYNSISIINDFLRFVMALNDGAAFGLFSGQRYQLIAVSIIAMTAILVIFFSCGKERKMFYIGLGISTGGICGNLYDRVFNDGLVRDFIDVYIFISPREYHWPAFNVGDSLLCVGIVLLFISVFPTAKPHRTHGQQHK